MPDLCALHATLVISAISQPRPTHNLGIKGIKAGLLCFRHPVSLQQFGQCTSSLPKKLSSSPSSVQWSAPSLPCLLEMAWSPDKKTFPTPLVQKLRQPRLGQSDQPRPSVGRI